MARNSRNRRGPQNKPASAATKTAQPNRNSILGIALALCIIAVYLPSLWSGFIWDDRLLLTENPAIVGPFGLHEIWTTKSADVCPLTLTIFWAEFKLWGLTAWPYHLINILIHALGAIILWRILLRLRIPGAWFGAALWALHPLQASSVAWIAEMKNTLSGVFFLLATLLFLKALAKDNANENPNRRWLYPLTLLCAVLAMAAKTSTLILPVELGLCAWWFERRITPRTLSLILPLALLAILPALLTLWTQQPGIEEQHWAPSLPERIATSGMTPWFYIAKLVFPYPLTMIYPRWQIDAANPISYAPLAVLVTALFIFWLYRSTWGRPCFFAFAWFLIALLPVSGLVEGTFWKYSFVADHFQYLAAIGPLTLIAALLSKNLSSQSTPGLISATVLLITLAALTLQQTFVFQDEKTLWQDALAKNPDSWIVQNEYGLNLCRHGEFNEGTAHLQRAIQLNPFYSTGHQNLGSIYIKQGRLQDALAEFQSAVQINPQNTSALFNLGSAYFQAGKINEAIQTFQSSLQVNPRGIDARNGLAFALQQIGQLDAAIAQFNEALRIQPSLPDATQNLAKAKASQKGNR